MTTALSNPVDAIAETAALFELGSKDTAQAMATRHGLTLDELGAVLSDPEFKSLVAKKKRSMQQDQPTFQKKARTIVDEALPAMRELILDGATSPSVRKDLYREIARQAGYSGPEEEAGGRRGPQVQLIIDLRAPDGTGSVHTAISSGKAHPAALAAIEEEPAA